MARATKKTNRSANGSDANLNFEAKLWAAADALRNKTILAGFPGRYRLLKQRIISKFIAHVHGVRQT